MPGSEPGVQLDPVTSQPVGTCSVIVYVPGTMVLNVALPVPGGPPDVLMLKVAGSPLPTPSLVVNVKLPLPPTVFFVTTSRPVASLKVHEPAAPAATVTVTV